MVLDFHTHIFPDIIADRAVSRLETAGVPCFCDGTASSLLTSMRATGITHSVVLNIATKPGQTKSVFDFSMRQKVRENAVSDVTLIPMASVHPFEEDWKGWLNRIKEAGFRGIKLQPESQSFFVDDPRLEPFYRHAVELGLMMVFHAGFDESLPDVTHSTPERFMNIMPILEQGTVVLAHMGSYNYLKESYELLCGKNVYFDTSFRFDYLDDTLIKAIFRKHSPDRILFGSDSPCDDQARQLQYFRQVFAPGFLSANDTYKILWSNGAQLLGLDKGVETVYLREAL